MKILCDMDGVVSNIMPLWLELYNKDYNDNLTEEQVTEWGIEGFVKPECGAKVMHYLSRRGFFRNAYAYPEAKVGIRKLLDLGADIWFVTKSTSYGHYMKAEKSAWVEEHYPQIGRNKIIFCKEKGIISGNMMIDDYFDNFRGFNGIRVLFERPWNKCVAVDQLCNDRNEIPCIKTGSWDDIINLVESLGKD